MTDATPPRQDRRAFFRSVVSRVVPTAPAAPAPPAPSGEGHPAAETTAEGAVAEGTTTEAVTTPAPRRRNVVPSGVPSVRH